MSDMLTQLAFLRKQRDSATDPQSRAMYEALITVLESPHLPPPQAVASPAQNGMAGSTNGTLQPTQPDGAPIQVGDMIGNSGVAIGPGATSNVHNINTGGGIYIEGDGTIVVGEQPLPMPEQLRRASFALRSNQYAEALALCQSILQQNPGNAQATLYRALALLGHNDIAMSLGLRVAQAIEADLIYVTADPALATTAWAVLGLLKIEFDTDQRQDTLKRASLAQIRKELRAHDLAALDHELWNLPRVKERTRRRLLDS